MRHSLIAGIAISIGLVGTDALAGPVTFSLPEALSILLSPLPDFVEIGGTSTDGADFGPESKTGPDPMYNDGVNIFGGSTTGAFASAVSPMTGVPFVGSAITNAIAEAGPGETAAAFSIAKAGAVIQISIQVTGNIVISTDPLILVNTGNASASMSLQLFLNGQSLFSAGAVLTDGILTPSGGFAASDFAVIASGPSTTASLTTMNFDVPFTISSSELNQGLPIEIDESMSVNSENGGIGIAGATSVPEPSSIMMLGTALIGLATVYRRRNRNH